MKKYILMNVILLVLLTAYASARADQACSALSKYIGTYFLVNKTCNGQFGVRLTVDYYHQNWGNRHTNFILGSGPMAVGVSMSPESFDHCTVNGDNVSVQTCTSGQSCAPKNWTYNFSGKKAILFADGCTAVFERP